MILIIGTIALLGSLFTSHLFSWNHDGWKWKTAPKKDKVWILSYSIGTMFVIIGEVLFILNWES